MILVYVYADVHEWLCTEVCEHMLSMFMCIHVCEFSSM